MIRSMIKRKDGRIDTIIARSVAEYTPNKISFVGRKQYKSTIYYASDFAVLDTETSHIEESCGWVYQWAVYFNNDYIYGRRPSELLELFSKWRNYYRLGETRRILVYVHNLSYDVQYLKHFFKAWDSNARFFCTDPHTILIVDLCGIRICCSYKLTNLSLAKLSADYAKTYAKASGEIDYTVIRYQDTELTSRDWLYMFSDVASQYDGVRAYLTAMGYKYAHDAPYTSTGFVRNTSRRASELEYWRERFLEAALTLAHYLLLHQAFIGGQTICSWMFAGRTVSTVGHVDFTSSYPTRQMLDYFPTGPFFEIGTPEDLEELRSLNNTFCTVGIYRFYNISIRPGVTAPYIPGSKCIFVNNDLRLNGKIIAADECSIALTEIDFKWIEKQYTWDSVEIGNLIGAQRGPLPDWMKSEVMRWYRNKCTLKKADPTLYAASKAMLNSMYGMSATAIVRDQYMVDEDLCIIPDPDKPPEDQIAKFYGSRKSFMPYQWGVWVTAHARDALHTLIEMIGYEQFLYCDTDSVFFRDSPQAREAVADYNQNITARALAAGAYVDENILGVATYEPDCKKFRALHAKCYAWTDDHDELHVTIAGIPKKATKWNNGEPVTVTNSQELGDINNLDDGFIFRHCGGSRITYLEDGPRVEVINGHDTELASAAIISDIEKEISSTMWTVSPEMLPVHIDFEQILN